MIELSIILEHLLYLFIAQGIIGILLFEVAWFNTRRQRQIVEERDSEFPQWRRRDVHLWTRAKFYPGAFCVMLPKMGLMLCYWVVLGVYLFLIFFRQDKSKMPTGWRHRCLMWSRKYVSEGFLFCYGHYIVGKDWKID